ncbi:hypothetical protein KCU67_g674, partial [Aureobasidium melanogenum]
MNDLEEYKGREEMLERIRTAGTISMSPELFEKLYLAPKTNVSGDLRKTIGNPTPLGLVGFVLGLTPLACCLMGWRGSGGLGAANIGVYFFIGGPLLMISGLMEFILGNTFPFVVFVTYGGVSFSLGASLQPFYNAAGAYSPTGSHADGLTRPEFNASLAFFPVAVACLNIIFMIAATRINAVFLLVFISAGLGFFLLASGLWLAAEGEARASSLLVGTGASWFFSAICGWYLLLIQILAIMGFTIKLPVGDFSGLWNRGKEKRDGDLES